MLTYSNHGAEITIILHYCEYDRYADNEFPTTTSDMNDLSSTIMNCTYDYHMNHYECYYSHCSNSHTNISHRRVSRNLEVHDELEGLPRKGGDALETPASESSSHYVVVSVFAAFRLSRCVHFVDFLRASSHTYSSVTITCDNIV
jgi:hypothetical protein